MDPSLSHIDFGGLVTSWLLYLDNAMIASVCYMSCLYDKNYKMFTPYQLCRSLILYRHEQTGSVCKMNESCEYHIRSEFDHISQL